MYNPRKLSLRILNDKNREIFFKDEKTKISFNTSESVSGAVGEANIQIIGLPVEQMSLLSNYKSVYHNNFKRTKVILWGGYANNFNGIFSGQIIEAASNFNDVNYELSLKVANGYFENHEYIVSDKLDRLSDVLKDLANKVGWGVNIRPGTDFVFNGTYSNTAPILTHLRVLAQESNTDIWASNNMIFCKPRGVSLNNKGLAVFGVKDLIGSPTQTRAGCELNIRMNPSIYSGQKIQVESKRITFLNNINFIVQSFNHSGDTYGGEWLTHINTITENNIYAEGN